MYPFGPPPDAIVTRFEKCRIKKGIHHMNTGPFTSGTFGTIGDQVEIKVNDLAGSKESIDKIRINQM
jgi:hypothetical protein